MRVLDFIARYAPAPTDGTVKPWASWAVQGPIGAVCRAAFRPRVDGWEHIPVDGPVLLVANHSGGGLAEILVLADAWLRRFGPGRPVAGIAHPLVMITPGIRDLFGALGAMPSTRDAVRNALETERAVLIFPGGDHEAFRPIWEADRVDLAGRRGFLRIAKACQVPVIPIGIRGSHYTLPVVWRSELLPRVLVVPRLFGVKRMPITVSGLLAGAMAGAALLPFTGPLGGAAAFVLCVASPVAWFTPVVPWPIHARIGEPIPPEVLFGEDDEDLSSAYARVESALQELVDSLAVSPPATDAANGQGTAWSSVTSTPEVTLQ